MDQVIVFTKEITIYSVPVAIFHFAAVHEFDGCMSHGDTYSEAYENIQKSMRGWIKTNHVLFSN